jgi:hypothetical protein
MVMNSVFETMIHKRGGNAKTALLDCACRPV